MEDKKPEKDKEKKSRALVFIIFFVICLFNYCSSESRELQTEGKANKADRDRVIGVRDCKAGEVTVCSLLPEIEGGNDYKIIIEKSRRILRLYRQERGIWDYVRSFDIALGAKGDTAAKQREGDGRTPTGQYYICRVHPESSYGEDPDTGGPLPSFLISYPNREDARKALGKGLIDTKTFERICDSIDAGKVPPQDTPLGSYIMIHGGGSEEDWTLGCIALDNEDMKVLLDYITVGVTVEIR